MLGQTFDLTDIPRLLALILIEVLLSADNALILAAIVQKLPQHLRNKALIIGATSAIFLRGLAIATVSFILKSRWLQLLGAAYLFYLCIHHFLSKTKSPTGKKPLHSLWKTIIVIELMDLSFAMDSVIAGIAFIVTPESDDTYSLFHPKIWIVYVGGIIGLLMIRYAAGHFIRLIDKFPNLSTSAYLLVGWVAVKLTVSILLPELHHFEYLFWTIFALIFISGLRKKQTQA
ncbi:MAG: hypothetical protein V4494_04375 [Chlamydiota bacterium]